MYFLSSSRARGRRNNSEMTNLSFDLQIVSLHSMFAMFFCCIEVKPLWLRPKQPRKQSADVVTDILNTILLKLRTLNMRNS